MHTLANTDLSDALATYFGDGVSAYPVGRFDHFDGGVDQGLRSAILQAVEDARALPVDWGDGATDTLDYGTRRMREQLRLKRPDLTDTGLDALAWSFSYEWR